jgi:two-component system cell cycle response regulator
MKIDQVDVEALQRELSALRQAAAQLEEELACERRQRKLLHEISRTLELERLLYILDGEISRMEIFDGYLINFINSRRDGLVCARARMPESHAGMEAIYTNFRFSFDEHDAIVDCFHDGKTVFLESDTADKFGEVSRRGFERWQATSMVIIPIPYADGAIGTVVAFRQQGVIDRQAIADLEERLLLFNEQIRNALLLNELKQQEQEAQSVLEDHRRFLQFVSEVNKLDTPELIYQAILDEFLRAFQFEIGYLTLAENNSLVMKHVSAGDPALADRAQKLRELMLEPSPLEKSSGASTYSFLQNNHILIPDAEPLRHLPMAQLDRSALEVLVNVRTVLHMPIRQHGTPIGMLGLFSLGECRPVNPGELKIIELLASFVGTAITNSKLYHVIGGQNSQIEALNRELQDKIQQLDEMVRRDQLTGLHNFGAFRTELTRRTSEFNRQSAKEGLSLTVIDVDHFKRFNDTYGHLAGNVVLQELASRIGRTARAMDIPCRFGGEEFVVILPRCEIDGAQIFAERLRAVVADTPFHVDGKLLPVTISVGCATYDADESMEAFLERADAALYRAKENGRNRVEVACVPASASARPETVDC